MTRIQFWILNLTSLLVAFIVGFEMYSSDKLDEAQLQAREAQLPLVQAEQMQPVARRMVEEIARRATVDPALKDVLTRQGLQITVTPRNAPPETAASNP